MGTFRGRVTNHLARSGDSFPKCSTYSRRWDRSKPAVESPEVAISLACLSAQRSRSCCVIGNSYHRTPQTSRARSDLRSVRWPVTTANASWRRARSAHRCSVKLAMDKPRRNDSVGRTQIRPQFALLFEHTAKAIATAGSAVKSKLAVGSP